MVCSRSTARQLRENLALYRELLRHVQNHEHLSSLLLLIWELEQQMAEMEC
jgi:hypothetical protein